MILEATSKGEIKGSAMMPGNIGMIELLATKSTVARWIKGPTEGYQFIFGLNLDEVVKASPTGRANEIVLNTRKNSDKARFQYFDPRGTIFLTNTVNWMDYGDPVESTADAVVAFSADFAPADLIAVSSTFTKVGKDNIVFDLDKTVDPESGEEMYNTSVLLLRSGDDSMSFRFTVKNEKRSGEKASLRQPKKKKQTLDWDDSDVEEDGDDQDDLISEPKKRGKAASDREINQVTNVLMDKEALTRAIKGDGFAFRAKFFNDLLRISSGLPFVHVRLLQGGQNGDSFCLEFRSSIPGFGTVKTFLMSVYVDS